MHAAHTSHVVCDGVGWDSGQTARAAAFSKPSRVTRVSLVRLAWHPRRGMRTCCASRSCSIYITYRRTPVSGCHLCVTSHKDERTTPNSEGGRDKRRVTRGRPLLSVVRSACMHASLLWSSGLMVMQVQVALSTTYSTAVVPNAIDRSAEGRDESDYCRRFRHDLTHRFTEPSTGRVSVAM